MIDRSAGQASEIFEDFLDFIRETPVDKQTVFLKPLLEGAVAQLTPKDALDKVRIQIEADDELTVQADQSKLKRVIINLVNNAVDALLDHKVSQPQIQIIASKQNGSVSIQVRDNGPGISPGLLKTLFEPFVTKNKSNGTGLCLAIVKHYVTAHGGKISVFNDNGAVFNITL